MPRIRTIKPEFFSNYKLYKAEQESGLPLRVAFAGLWTLADREGRFKWIPQELKLGTLPFDDVDFSRVLHALGTRGYIKKYRGNNGQNEEFFGFIPSWQDHQCINNRESTSLLPTPNQINMLDPEKDACTTRAPRVDHACQGERKGKEGKGKERKGIETQSESRSAGVIQTDWHPDENSVAWAINLGATREFIENTLVPGFVAYWRDTDDKKKSWNQTFIRNPVVKREIGHFKARQKQYGTQASGSASPSAISAKREHHKRISDFAGQYLDDEPIEPNEPAD